MRLSFPIDVVGCTMRFAVSGSAAPLSEFEVAARGSTTAQFVRHKSSDRNVWMSGHLSDAEISTDLFLVKFVFYIALPTNPEFGWDLSTWLALHDKCSELTFGIDPISSRPLNASVAGELKQWEHTLTGGVDVPVDGTVAAHYHVPKQTDVCIMFPPRTVGAALEMRVAPRTTRGLSFTVTPSISWTLFPAKETMETLADSRVVTWTSNNPKGNRFLSQLRVRSDSGPIIITVCKSAQQKPPQ
jgi:hypothetical protein